MMPPTPGALEPELSMIPLQHRSNSNGTIDKTTDPYPVSPYPVSEYYDDPKDRRLLGTYKVDSTDIPERAECHMHPVMMRNLNEINHYRAVELRCKSWKCPFCNPRLKVYWHKRLIVKMLARDHIEVHLLLESEWKAFQKMMERKGVEKWYAKLDQSAGQVAVFTADKLGGEEIPKEDRENRLILCMLRVPATGGKPISMSKDPKSTSDKKIAGVKSKREPEWTKMGTIKFSTLEEEARMIRDSFPDMGIGLSYVTMYNDDGWASRALDILFPMHMMKHPEVHRTWDSADEVLWKSGVNCYGGPDDPRGKRQIS